MEYSKTSFERTKQLYEANAATQIAYDESRNSLVKAETSLQNAQSNLDKAKVNLGYAEIYSPIDGVVLSREVEVGQKVTFSVDAYIDDIFYGEVQQIRLQPTTTNNVVTYTVIITAHNPDLKLLPGMTASVTIVTEEEIRLANSYCKLMEIRYGDNLKINFDIDERMLRDKIIPLSLQVLIENAIKHNVISDKMPLAINVSSDYENRKIIVRNKIQPKIDASKGNGIGLANLSERYRLKWNTDIEILNNNVEFCVVIKLNFC